MVTNNTVGTLKLEEGENNSTPQTLVTKKVKTVQNWQTRKHNKNLKKKKKKKKKKKNQYIANIRKIPTCQKRHECRNKCSAKYTENIIKQLVTILTQAIPKSCTN